MAKKSKEEPPKEMVAAKSDLPSLPSMPTGTSPEVSMMLADAFESLESFEGIGLSTLRFTNEGFHIVDGEPPVDSFEGILIYTKESNVFYEKTYKPGQNLPPDCASPDGKVPTSGENIQAKECKTCPQNQFGSSRTGDGKACKNTRPTFFLVGGGVIPQVLRVPPTSLKYIRKYIMNVATNYGSYFAVKTRVSIFKEEEGQTYSNIKFQVAGPVKQETTITDGFITDLGKADVRAIRAGWMPLMQAGTFGIDEGSMQERPAEPAMPDVQVDVENPQF